MTVTAVQQVQNNLSLSNKNWQENTKRSSVQQVGNYIIYKKTLGAGSMGTVKLAECLSPNDHRLYAVKIMPKVNLDTESDNNNKDPKNSPKEQEQRTIREMAIMRLLHHPNICKLREWIVQGNQYYMFLEYIPGGQLLDFIMNNGKLKETLARKFARQIVSAIDYCHRNSIVHRDLKIENILLTNNQEIKIIDFGLSNIYSPMRLLNTFCGSLYFAAPELLRAKYYTGPEVDVWSFGVILYVLVCGRVPFDDTNLPALHQKIKEGHVEYPDHLSQECVDLLSKILVVDPLKRESLSFVIQHPWMNKNYYEEPIFNHLPYRPPLTSIDPLIVEGMQGFGLGTFKEIHSNLIHIISSPEYQHAAAQVDKQYHHNAISTLKYHQYYGYSKKSDPQTLPVMYDPLISIYYLVKERKEFEENQRMLANEGYAVQVGRSISTSLSKPTHHPHRRNTEYAPSSRHDKMSSSTRENEPNSATIKRKTSEQGLSRSFSQTNRNSKVLFQSANSYDDNSSNRRRMKSSPSPNLGGRFIEEGLEEPTAESSNTNKTMPRVSTQPKSLFNFGRRHLFRTSPEEMFIYIQRTLKNLNIQCTPIKNEDFMWQCKVFDWYGKGPFEFTLMIYQARWASGRLGVKVLEAEEDEKSSNHIYHTILNELGSMIST